MTRTEDKSGDSEPGQAITKQAGAGGRCCQESRELSTFGLAEDHKNQPCFLQMLFTPAGVKQSSDKDRTAARALVTSCLPSSISWLAAMHLGTICLAFLIHPRKLAFEVVWKASKETCFVELVLLPNRKDSAFHQRFASAICVSPAPTVHGPGLLACRQCS